MRCPFSQNGIMVCGCDSDELQVMFVGQLGVDIEPEHQDVRHPPSCPLPARVCLPAHAPAPCPEHYSRKPGGSRAGAGAAG